MTEAVFRTSILLQLYTKKNTAIVIIIYTTEHVQSLSSFGPNLVEIFEVRRVTERCRVVDVWVLVDVWVMVDVWVVVDVFEF